MDDLYLILGVEPDAKPEAIQERFRFLAQAFHPDKYSSLKQKQFAEEEFKKINNAYQILSNPRKRADYDSQRKRTINYSRTNTDDVNRKAEEAARQRAWEVQRKKAEEAARQRTKEEQRKKAEEAARLRAQEERKKKAEEAARKNTPRYNSLVVVYSFNAECGNSNITANLAAQAAMSGKRVAIVDTNFQSPGIHVLFGLDESNIKHTLNDYLHDKCAVTDAAFLAGRGSNLQPGAALLADKSLWLVPSSINTGEISRVLRDGYDVNVLNKGFKTLCKELQLDYLLIDTRPGLNEETLLSIGISDETVIILCPNQRDFQGTATMLNIARGLDVPKINLLVNKALSKYDHGQIREEIETKFQASVAGVLPWSEDLVDLGDTDIFSLRFPNHPWSQELRRAAKIILNLQ
jgi:MinD-like ATPase involved in chromosome partitioning or flagellar assembly